MPIRPDLLQFYGKTWKEETRPRILARAGNKCEQCGVPDKLHALRAAGWWIPVPDTWINFRTLPETIHALWNPPDLKVKAYMAGFPRMICREVRIVIGVAHLDHTPGHDTDDNLKALCQWCHLNHDKLHHAETRQTRKDAGRPLLQGLTNA